MEGGGVLFGYPKDQDNDIMVVSMYSNMDGWNL